jgi:hypothetical protein
MGKENFTGDCTIHLHKAAIVVKNGRTEIGRWPHTCIRQFLVNETTGRFSFVSGSRGPYGMATYSFTLRRDLVDLKTSITSLTGAQFSEDVSLQEGLDNNSTTI